MAVVPFSCFSKECSFEDNSQTNRSVMFVGADVAFFCSLAASVLSCACVFSDYQNSRVPEITVPEKWSLVAFL